MDKFDKEIERLMEMLAGDAFGDTGAGHGGDFGNTDWYAPGDARVPVVIGSKTEKKKGNKKNKKKKDSKKCKKDVDVDVIPVQRRVFPNT